MKQENILLLIALTVNIILIVFLSFGEYAQANKRERTKYEQCYKLAPTNKEIDSIINRK